LSESRLTIVIPTYNRPDRLPGALDSALDQYRQGTEEPIDVQIIIADDGDVGVTEDILKADFATQCLTGQIRHLPTCATYAWPNWKAGIEAATTDYVAWLQDDDAVCEVYADRIITAFDRAPQANVWLARCLCAPDGQMALWYSGNGPFVPMDCRKGKPFVLAEGSILASSSYFTSWALSPGIAYRRGPALDYMLATMPERCDIFVERLGPALVARGGHFIADPAVVGYWIQHVDQLSIKQHKDQPEQTTRFLPVLDALMDEFEGWEASLAAWCQVIPAPMLLSWIKQIEVTCREGGGSLYRDRVARVMFQSLEGRIRISRKPSLLKRAGSWLKSKVAAV
jgi:glycosyl transferase family 2